MLGSDSSSNSKLNSNHKPSNPMQAPIHLGTSMRLADQGLAHGVASTQWTAMDHMQAVAVDITNNNNTITIIRKHSSSYTSRDRIKVDPGRTKMTMICGDNGLSATGKSCFCLYLQRS